jgi:peptidoglycan biosynthesis protein MviN/MurJ (putative lipid II flippase)
MSITAGIEVVGLLWSLHGRLDGIELPEVIASVARSAIAAGAAALLVFGGLQAVDLWAAGLRDNAIGRLVVLLALGAAGIFTYLAAAAALRSHELGELRRMLGGRFRRGGEPAS